MADTPSDSPVASLDFRPDEEALLVALRSHDAAWENELHRCRHTRALRLAIEEAGYRLVPEAVIEKARLVSQWHDALNSGPPEVLNAELGELAAIVRRVNREQT